MVVNGKVALNPYTTDIEYMDLVSIGDMIVANEDGSQFNVTENKEYRLLAYLGDCVKIIDDTGKEEWYSVDYFHSKYRKSINTKSGYSNARTAETLRMPENPVAE